MEINSNEAHQRAWSARSIGFTATMQRAELYYMACPGSPSAVRRPRLLLRGKLWTALSGVPALEKA